jgi:hypothetical protein
VKLKFYFLLLSVLLVFTYTVTALLNALQHLSPETLPDQGLASAGLMILDIAICSGFLAGGCYVVFPLITSADPRQWSSIPQIWTLGLLVVIVSFFMSEPFVERIRLYLGYPLIAVALGFWLMRQFSNITPAWAELGLRVVAGELILAGILLATMPLMSNRVSYVALVVVMVMYWIFAAHSYRALSDRNQTQTLAAHWYALAVMMFLVGPGFLGAVQAVPAVFSVAQNTHLFQLAGLSVRLGAVAVLLGVANQAAAEMRGENRRVTGLIPFWLMSFGIVIAGVGMGGAGLIQVYLVHILAVSAFEMHKLAQPLYLIWCSGQGMMGVGITIYVLTFWLRRPRIFPL